MQREKYANNTEALIKLVEEADDFESLVIIYRKKDECGGSEGFLHVGETTNATLNWMVDRFKLYLLGALDKD